MRRQLDGEHVRVGLCLALAFGFAGAHIAAQPPGGRTVVGIRGSAFLINGEPTYTAASGFRDADPNIAGTLLNVRAVQAIFDDANYPDGGTKSKPYVSNTMGDVFFDYPHYGLSAAEAGAYASLPLYFGAIGNWGSGVLVDRIYRQGHWRQSRRLPAIAGFLLGTIGLITAPSMPTALGAVTCFSIATLGVDMTLSPSWTACQDIAGPRTGVLSGAMNMFGNVGSFVSSITFPVLLQTTGSTAAYFYLAAALNVAAIICWGRLRPNRRSGARTIV